MNICQTCNKGVPRYYNFCPVCGNSMYGDKTKSAADPAKVAKSAEQIAIDDCSTAQFFSLAQTLSTAENIDQLLAKISAAVEGILGSERSAIMLLDDTGEFLYFKTASGEDILKKLKIPVGKGIAGWIAKEQKPEIVNDPYKDKRFSPEADKKTGFKTKSIIGVPMIFGNKLVGVIEAINKKSGKFDNKDLEMLTGFSGLAAVTVVDTKLKADQQNFFQNMLDFMAMGSEALRHPEPTEKGHAWEMARYALQMGKKLQLSTEQLKHLNRAALIHDIGFIGLENPELVGIKLDIDIDDKARFLLHPLIGGEMLKSVKIMQDLAGTIRCHHRYMDGSGFPGNIPVSSITKESEIISILERYFMKKDKAKVEPEKFSPEIFQAFCEVVQ